MGASSEGDALLVQRVRAGDDRALAAIYDQHGGVVYGLARQVARDEQLARDVTQEVFTYLWEMPHRVDLSHGSLRTYLALLAHRLAVDEVRRRRADTGAALPEREPGPEVRVVESGARTKRDKDRTALEMLPAEEQTAVQLAYYEAFTYADIAKVLGISEGTAKTRLRTALARLRTLHTDQAPGVIS